ncbi:MAG TPA: hypothetical protein VGC88_08695 [Terriglobales bacterium]|jgi:hypothetical protein
MRLTLWAMMPETYVSAEQQQALQRHCALRKIALSEDVPDLPTLADNIPDGSPSLAMDRVM